MGLLFGSRSGTGISVFLLAFTFGTVCCDDSGPRSIYDAIFLTGFSPDLLKLIAMDYANTTDPSEIGIPKLSAELSSVDYSVNCGKENSEYPFTKVLAQPDQPARVIGGSDTEPGDFPWQISLQDRSTNIHFCGGSIVSENVIVTAGHCVVGEDPSELQVVAGADDITKPTGNEQIRGIKMVLNKLNYTAASIVDDIALLVLDEPLKFDPLHVAPVCLPKSDFVYDGLQGVITGWGFVTEDGERNPILQVAPVPIVPVDKCQEAYEKQGRAESVTKCSICAGSRIGGKDSCQGDSGGPMTCVESDGRHYLCGVVSWGVGCGRPESPGVYTFTPCFSDWIEEQISVHRSAIV